MSVNSVRVFMEKSGCGIAIGVVLAVVLIAGLGFQCNNQQMQNSDGSPVVAEVAGVGVTSREVDSRASVQFSYFGAAIENLPPSFEANIYYNTMKEIFTQARLIRLGESRGVAASDEEIVRVATDQLDKAFVDWKAMKVTDGSLTADATDAQVNEEFKKESGSSFEELKSQRLASLREQLADSATRASVLAGHIRSVLFEEELKKLSIADDELKRAFQTATVRKIVLDRAKVDAADIRTRAQEIVDEVKSGAVTFEQAMDRYSNASPIEGKRLSETVDKVSLRQSLTDESMAPLRGANAGDIVIIDSPVGAEILQIIDISGDLPADFESAKDRHRRDVLGPRANEIITKAVDALADEYPVKWSSTGYEVLYDVADALGNLSGADYERRVQVLEPLYQRALTAQSDLVGRNMAALAAYTAVEGIWDRATEEQRKNWTEQYLSAIDTMASLQPRASLLFEKVEVLIQLGDKAAWDTLVELASSTHDLTEAGQQRFSQIFQAEDRLKEKGLENTEAAAKIQAEYDRWNADRAQQQKAEEEARRKLEEERKKFEEEERKQQEQASKPPGENGAETPGS